MQSDFFEHTKSSEHLPAVPFPLQKLGRGGLGLKISERRLILALGDIVMINAALTVYLLVQGRLSFTDGLLWDRVPWFVTLTVMWLAAGTFFDNYDLSRAAKSVDSAAIAGLLAMLVGGVYLLTPRLTPFLPDRRIYIFLLPLLAASFVIIWRAIYANFITQPTFQRRLLIIGAGQSGAALVNALGATGKREGETAYNIVGFIDDEPDKLNQLVANVPVLGNRYDLLNLARRLQPDEIVVAITHGHLIHPNLFKAVLDCREMGIPITTMAHLYEDLTGRVPVEHAGHDLQVVMPINRPASHRLYLAVRRAIEVVVALLGCLQLLLVIPFVWLANRFSAPGDLFYRQERVGEGGRVFNVIKFRSMIMNAEQG
ncbi:MAG: sugar transferase, partial [Anaerolineales bacterium]|nr:sugar transferase [Anaerolineales bacterium]